MLKYIISAISIYFFLGAFLFLIQRKILFNVSGLPKKPSEYGLNNILELEIPTIDGVNLLAWYSKPKINKPTLLYLHGNSFDIGERSYRIQRYIQQGWGILLLAWRGYSGNKGYPSEVNLYKDGEAALSWLKNFTPTNLEDIVLYGESLGSAVAVELATRYAFKSVVLEAPFTSISDIAQKRYKIFPVKLLILDNFDNISKINKIFTPILIISGKKDEVIPHSHSQKLFLKANEPKKSVFIDEARHNNLYDFGIEKQVIEFSL